MAANVGVRARICVRPLARAWHWPDTVPQVMFVSSARTPPEGPSRQSACNMPPHTCADAQAQTGTHRAKRPRARSFEFLLPALRTHTTLPEILLLAAAKMPKSPVTFPLMYAEAQLGHQHSQTCLSGTLKHLCTKSHLRYRYVP